MRRWIWMWPAVLVWTACVSDVPAPPAPSSTHASLEVVETTDAAPVVDDVALVESLTHLWSSRSEFQPVSITFRTAAVGGPGCGDQRVAADFLAELCRDRNEVVAAGEWFASLDVWERAVVLGHEWGHAVHASNYRHIPPPKPELVADCLAGVWWSSELIPLDMSPPSDAELLQFFSRWTDVDSEVAATVRSEAFRAGLASGVDGCVEVASS